MRGALDTRERSAVLFLAVAVAVGVAVRLAVFRGSGFPSDVSSFMAWGEHMVAVGPARFYGTVSFADYPPGFLYVLWLIAALFDGEVLRLVVKALSIPADIAIAVMLYRLVRYQAGPWTAAVAGAIWMLQPAPIFAGPFWGQVDAWGTLPYLAALLAAARRRWVLAGALAGIAVMIKPQFGLAGIVVGAAAAFELREARWRPLAQVTAAGLLTVGLIALPFRAGPDALIALVRGASETYPYTSLFAFNGWSIFADFWKPDGPYVVWGAILLLAGLAASLVPLWRRRDEATLLASGAFAAMAFYFLPTRAHERYLFPALALLLPFAVTRRRIAAPYAVFALTFFVTLYFAFTRYPQNGLLAPGLLESTLFTRNGQIALALLLMASAAAVVWLLARGEMRLGATFGRYWRGEALTGERWRLPAGLAPGRAPTKRDLMLALAVALAVIATRGYRLDWPRDMYFDEIYHANTAFELLAQQDPYEWTHPPLAKEVMALGILAFGDDRVDAVERAPAGASAFAVANDGTRAYVVRGDVVIEGQRTQGRTTLPGGPARTIAWDGPNILAATDSAVYRLDAASSFAPGEARPLGVRPSLMVVANGRVVVAGADRMQIVAFAGAAPGSIALRAVALTARPNSDEVYAADPAGTIHVISASTARETATLTGPGPVSSLAWGSGAERLYAGRADSPTLDYFLPASTPSGTGSYAGSVSLENDRTGRIAGGVRALAFVPRTRFLYALAGGKLVVAATAPVDAAHGTAPYVSIPVRGTMLGVDGEGDRLAVLAGEGTLELVPTGRHAFAWRAPGVLFGALLVFFLVLLARRLFASPLVAVLVGLAALLDGLMFSQARIGMNDVYVGAFLVMGWYFVVAAHRPRRGPAVDLVIAGMAFGLALASKWVAAYALAGLGLATIGITAWSWSRGRPGTGGPFDLLAEPRARIAGRDVPLNPVVLLLCFAAIPASIYLLSYAPWFGGKTVPFGWSLIELTQQMYWYHSGLTSPHPAGAPWWTWPLDLKPTYWYLGSPGEGQTAVIYNAGNIVLFWGALAATVWVAVAAWRGRSVALGFVLFAMLTQFVAWIPITRVLFFYHFFTVLPFYLLALAVALTALWEGGRRRAVGAYMAVAAAAFVFFYPFVSGQPVAADSAAAFYVLPTWQYGCQFYPESAKGAVSLVCDLGAGAIPWSAVIGRVALGAGVALAGLAALYALELGAAQRLRRIADRLVTRRAAMG